MNEFVKSLKRLFSLKTIDEKIIAKLFDEKKITKEERDYILG